MFTLSAHGRLLGDEEPYASYEYINNGRTKLKDALDIRNYPNDHTKSQNNCSEGQSRCVQLLAVFSL